MERIDRFDLFLVELANAPAAATAEEAFKLLADTLNSVEDRYSGVAMEPANYQNDGRLYPPQRDSMRTIESRSDLVRYRSRRHNV